MKRLAIVPRYVGCWMLCLISLALAIFASPASATSPPPANHHHYSWLRAECVETDTGFRSIGNIRTFVDAVPRSDGEKGSRYYQEVKVQVDRAVNSSATSWRQVASKTYDWSRFTRRQTPIHSTSAVRTGLQNDAATLSAKATVWLKRIRTGPDATVWKYTVRSATFQCLGSADTPF